MAKTRKNIVVGSGYGKKEKKDFLFIGEAPGVSEDILNEPFVGLNGKLLKQMIVEAKIENFFITYSILCRPVDETGSTRMPTRSEVQNCYSNVLTIINFINPRCIIFIGKIAQQYYSTLIKCKNIQIDHPAFILRKGGRASFLYKENLKRLERLNYEFRNIKK